MGRIGVGGKRIRGLAEWTFGGGPGYCQNCRDLGAPCATGGTEEDDEAEICPFDEHALQTTEGSLAWGLIARGSSQIRIGGLGSVIGLDYTPLLKMAEIERMDMRIFSYLLPLAENGLLSGIRKQDPTDHD